MQSEMRLETRPDSVEFFLREKRVARYLHNAVNPGLSALSVMEGRGVTQSCFDDGVSIWVGHSDLAGYAFGERSEAKAGSYRTENMVARRGSQSVGLQHTCGCFTPGGECLLTEVRTLRVQPGPAQGMVLDLRLELCAPQTHAVTLTRSGRGLLRICLASAFVSSGGTIRNSMGEYGIELDQRIAAWCGGVGVVLAETVGLVVLDHPTNLGHPPVWYLDPSGTLEINPFYGAESVVAAGTSIEFRYRIHTHAGYVDQGWADLRLRDFAATSP